MVADTDTGAHPRAGGENYLPFSPAKKGPGSSPRGRGKRPSGRYGRRAHGLIPARAGKTRLRLLWRRCCRAHPRAGGENAPVTSTSGGGQWLIPARAGKTPSKHRGYDPRAAHPRAGGENKRSTRTFKASRGSSPRGRGKHFLTCAFIERIGQILETLELAVSSGSYSLCDVYATDAPQDQARNTGLALPSSRAAS